MAAAAGVALVSLARAALLVSYPYDWSPDEGLAFDYARRLIENPAGLYGRSISPYPAFYGPGLALFLAPIVAAFRDPLAAGRLLAIVWTAVSAGSVYALVRRQAGAGLACAAAALALLPPQMSTWHLLVRVDGLMHALWLLAAVCLLPSRLERAADRLSSRRIGCGVALLFLAALVKPTAIVHGAPLVVGWLLVDLRSAARLSAALVATAAAWLLAIQWLTDGGYLWTMLLWRIHQLIPGQVESILLYVLRETAATWVFLGAGLVSRSLRGEAPFRDSAWLLIAGGALAIPLAAKGGANEVYLFPLVAAAATLGGRLFGDAGTKEREARPERAHEGLGEALATLAIVLLARHPVRHPTPQDEATARFLYEYVLAHSARAGRPLFAAMPDWAYFLARQPVAVHGSALPYLVEADVPGTDAMLRRIQAREYGIVVTYPEAWPWKEEWRAGLRENYALAGACRLGYYYGTYYLQLLFVPRDAPLDFEPPRTARCSRNPADLQPSARTD